MATGRSSFAKRQRDMAKKAKAAAKREKRLNGPEEGDEELEDDEPVNAGPQLSNEEIMEKVAELHRRYDDGQMELDDFDEERRLTRPAPARALRSPRDRHRRRALPFPAGRGPSAARRHGARSAQDRLPRATWPRGDGRRSRC